MAKIEKSVEVNLSAHTVYNQLTQFTEYPRFMEGVQEVQQLDDTHLHWHAKPDGEDREWDTEITEQVPDKIIAWRNISSPKNTGRVTLEPIDDSKTKVTLSMECAMEGVSLQDIDKRESEMSQRNEQDLIRFKKFLESRDRETGEGHDAHVVQPGTPQNEAESWLPRLIDVWEEPLVVMRRMSEEMDRLFARFIGRPLGMSNLTAGSRNWMPPVEIARRDNQLIICAELPGIKREDVHVEIKDDKLTIEGDRPVQVQRPEQEYRRSERSYGHFYRIIPLPNGVDPNSAAASEGVRDFV